MCALANVKYDFVVLFVYKFPSSHKLVRNDMWWWDWEGAMMEWWRRLFTDTGNVKYSFRTFIWSQFFLSVNFAVWFFEKLYHHWDDKTSSLSLSLSFPPSLPPSLSLSLSLSLSVSLSKKMKCSGKYKSIHCCQFKTAGHDRYEVQ